MNALTYADSRQVRRQRERAAVKATTRPGPMAAPLIPNPPRQALRSRILWTTVVGRTEFYMHATKGLRRRYIGRAA